MALLNDQRSLSAITGAVSGSGLNAALNNQSQGFPSNGLITQPISGSDGGGLPSSNVQPLRLATTNRNIAHWFVPEVGVINMYINPQSITYNNAKVINTNRTKGGYNIQYWGEELTTLTINGHTGSSGVEGLNVLEEIYRAEQYLFDPIALMMASDSSISGLNNSVDSSLGNLGGFDNSVSNNTSGTLAFDPASQNILPQSIPSLASIALGIEFYYSGWVYRGFFNSFSFTESVGQLGLFVYDIKFTATQRRGYRANNFAWQRAANYGPSSSEYVPLSYSDILGANIFNNTLI